MKKTIALLLACLMILSMAACNKSTPKTPAATDADQSAAPADAADSSDVAPQDNSGGLITIDEDPAPEADASEPDATQNSDEYVSEGDDTHTAYNSIDEINQATGGRIARPTNVELPFEEFEVVKVGETDVAQYVFEAGGVPCGIRFCPDFNLCISDMQYDDGSLLFDGSHEEETVTYNGSTAAHWETVDGQYVMVVASEDEDFFNSLYEEIRAGSVPGDV